MGLARINKGNVVKNNVPVDSKTSDAKIKFNFREIPSEEINSSRVASYAYLI